MFYEAVWMLIAEYLSAEGLKQNKKFKYAYLDIEQN